MSMFAAPAAFRCSLPFALRSWPLLIAVVVLPCSARPPEMQRAREQVEAVQAIEKLGGHVYYEDAEKQDDGTSKGELFAPVSTTALS